jgi:hypothetical protein
MRKRRTINTNPGFVGDNSVVDATFPLVFHHKYGIHIYRFFYALVLVDRPMVVFSPPVAGNIPSEFRFNPCVNERSVCRHTAKR